MNTTLFDVMQQPFTAPIPESVLSFAPFISYLKNRKEETQCHKTRYFNYVIEQFEQFPELLKQVGIEEVGRYADQLQLVYTTLVAVAEDEETHLWTLSAPGRPVIFYSTHAASDLISNIIRAHSENTGIPKSIEQINNHKLFYSYGLILEKCYQIPLFYEEMVHPVEDVNTGLLKYYKRRMDNRFINIHNTQPLPALDPSIFQSGSLDKEELLAYLQEKLPLDMFSFEGFAVATIEEVTSDFAVDTIKSMLLDHSAIAEENYYSGFIRSLKTLVGSNEIEFGLLPALKVNDKLVITDSSCINSMLFKAAEESGRMEIAYRSMTEEYFKNPKLRLYTEISPEDESRHEYLQMMKAYGIKAYAIIPVFFKNALVGVLELYSKKENLLSENMITKLNPTIPLFSQLLKNIIDEFDANIERIIKEKFTAVQPSVQWKFNEVAWRYLRDTGNQSFHAETEEIIFENVHPLYGAVDIRNSTVERNQALRKDLEVQFTFLLKILRTLKLQSGLGIIDEKIFMCQKWLDRITNPLGFNQEIEVNDFLENNIAPFLFQFSKTHPELQAGTQEYFRSIDETTGPAYHNRRQLEKSMSTVISSVNNYFDMLKGEIQQAYPCYFEKFRTDGVEYDIYIGQTITPDRPYSDMYLKNLRLMQLSSMAAITKYSHSLSAQLSRPVETTQLIFIHSHPITIRFRKDEKRFDVEGAYNIRYQIIKKRIDKVRIRNSSERLTQPGKIALVYFTQKDAEEYVSYIRYLQEQKILQNDLEYLELEELQGVSGLKALRVGVAVNNPE